MGRGLRGVAIAAIRDPPRDLAVEDSAVSQSRANTLLRRAETAAMSDRPLRVLIDARMLVGRFSGVARVVTQLVDHLARDPNLRVIALCGNAPYTPWSGRKDIEVVGTSFSREDRSADRRLHWERSHLARFIRRSRADVYHATWNSGVPRGCPVPAVLTIHDLIPWTQRGGGWNGRWRAWCYRRAVRSSSRRATLLTVVSEFVRQQVLETLRLPPEKVSAIPNGVNITAPMVRPSPSHSPFVLYVGGHEPRKNVAGVFETMRRYWERHGFGVALRLAGTIESMNGAAAAALNKLPAQAPVEFLGQPTDAELAREYASATALLMLSYAEGFGLPVLEAMAHGCPVIAANRASLPEVVGDAGILVDPDAPDSIVAALEQLIENEARRTELIHRGLTRARQLSWSVTAEQYARLYVQVAAPPARTSTPKNFASIPRSFAEVSTTL